MGASGHQRKSPGIAGACDYLRYSEHSTPTGSRTPVFGLRTRRQRLILPTNTILFKQAQRHAQQLILTLPES
jgi:hypothetical protein